MPLFNYATGEYMDDEEPASNQGRKWKMKTTSEQRDEIHKRGWLAESVELSMAVVNDLLNDITDLEVENDTLARLLAQSEAGGKVVTRICNEIVYLKA